MVAWAERHGIVADEGTLLEAYDLLRRPIQDRRPALRYAEVLRQTFDALAAQFGGPADPDLRQAFGETAAHHRPFPDSDAALAGFKARGLRLGALSNNDEASLAQALGQLSVGFDVVVTAERVGAYKPDLAHFHAALADLLAFGIPPERVLHVAQSRRADIVPAKPAGLDLGLGQPSRASLRRRATGPSRPARTTRCPVSPRSWSLCREVRQALD